MTGDPGHAEGPWNERIMDYANNDGWFDDVSDGPVDARVTKNAEKHQALVRWAGRVDEIQGQARATEI